jgi:hypothetical protein
LAECEATEAPTLAAFVQREATACRCARHHQAIARSSPGHRQAISSVALKFEDFLSSYNAPVRDTWATCTDIEILVFLEHCCLVRHEG